MSGFLTSLFERRSSFEIINDPKYEWPWLGWRADSGITVSHSSALTFSAFFACVKVLTDSIGSLPVILYRRLPDGSRERAMDHPLYKLMHNRVNPVMPAMIFRETLQGHLATWGNAYAEIVYDSRGRVTELWPLNPGMMEKVHLEDIDGQLQVVYDYRLPNGKLRSFTADKIFHVPGFGFDGLVGYSMVSLARQSIGLGLATEKFGAKFFENGATPGGVLEHPGQLGQAAFENVRNSWNEMHQGLENTHRIAILEEGMKYTQVGIPPEDAQYLQTRKFQVNEVARWFRIPAHMVGDLERSTNNNIEQQAIEFITQTLMAWLVRWEQVMNQRLLLEREQEQYYFEFLLDNLLRGDMESRFRAYTTGINAGFMSRNEARVRENWNKRNGLDALLIPMNMAVVGEDGNIVQAEAADRQDEQARNSFELIKRTGGDKLVKDLPQRETRGRQAANSRHKLAGRQMAIFSDQTAQILRRERNDVMSMAKKILPVSGMAAFEGWLNEFYEQHAKWSAAKIYPYMSTYAGIVADYVGIELGKENLDEVVTQFVRAYADSFGTREAARSLERLLRLVQKPSMTAEDLLGEMESLFEEMLISRPEAIGHEEAVRENNAVAVAIYGAMGVSTLTSVATGESSCPYCRALDGKTIAIGEYFLTAGQEFLPEGADSPLKSGQDVKHAPYHGGCDCMTVAGD